MSRARTLRFLKEIESSPEPMMTIYLPPGTSLVELDRAIAEMSVFGETPLEILDLLANSATGAIVFWGKLHKCLIIPPFPIAEKKINHLYDAEALYALLQNDALVALLLIRLGDYAIGLFRGEQRISSKVGTGLVHSRHKKGGSSQGRFQRHREKQMESFFERVCHHSRGLLEPHLREIDYVIYGGERNTLRAFRKQCQFLSAFDNRTLGMRLNVRKPRQASLESAIVDVWCSDIIEWTQVPQG